MFFFVRTVFLKVGTKGGWRIHKTGKGEFKCATTHQGNHMIFLFPWRQELSSMAMQHFLKCDLTTCHLLSFQHKIPTPCLPWEGQTAVLCLYSSDNTDNSKISIFKQFHLGQFQSQIEIHDCDSASHRSCPDLILLSVLAYGEAEGSTLWIMEMHLFLVLRLFWVYVAQILIMTTGKKSNMLSTVPFTWRNRGFSKNIY